ncbi:L-type lectin-domain containing protein [Taibaiella soli]|uniref:L-type lectin-like domain-containing protein n=1 Tax=Taibaiella soli TaxID=1649169 RepID=A0A2W2BU37_9BACT|nr:L-type lectin-domain containing protein [Taibaiella soli]PZF71333.1 hypothetical protein DN068_18740 [Taibaiella soli]
MKSFLFTVSLLLGCVIANAQQQSFMLSLVGTPANTKGWKIGPETYAFYHDNYIVLTDPDKNQEGYLFYEKPLVVLPTSQFTALFEIQISPNADTLADGLAFWFLTKPEKFKKNAGLGIPVKPTGLVLAFDTHDDNGDKKNPQVVLWNAKGTEDYKEGAVKAPASNILNNQAQLADGNWHKVVVQYDMGTIKVYLDGNLNPAIVSKTPLSYVGYFGFSAATGTRFNKQCIRGVMIASGLLPVTMAVH